MPLWSCNYPVPASAGSVQFQNRRLSRVTLETKLLHPPLRDTLRTVGLTPPASRKEIALDQPSSPSLRGLLIAQFFAAFNNNAFKLMVALLAIRGLTGSWPADELEAISQRETTTAFVAYTLPLCLFSLVAGFFADRFSKRSLILGLKVAEMVLLAGATSVLYYNPGNRWALLALLALLGTVSALFSPAKYGILPELLPHEELSKGNGLLEMWTFLAIISGTGAGGFLLDHCEGKIHFAGLFLALLAVVGIMAAETIPPVPAAGNKQSPLTAIRNAWQVIRGDRVLWLAVLGQTFFWTIVSLVGQDVLVFTKALGLSDTAAVLPLAAFGIGTGLGSFVAGRLSAAKVETGLIPLGAFGIALGTLLMGIFAQGFTSTMVFMTLMGVASGFLVVPLDALLQWRTPRDQRGSVIALTNTFVFGGVLAGSLAVGLLAGLELNARQILFGAALLTAAGTVWALWLLPLAFLRLVLLILTHTFYRVRVLGRERVPQEGGALLIPNHVSFVDGLFLLAAVDRPIRMIVDASYFEHPLFKPFMRAIGAIPISASGGPRMILRALKDAGDYLDRGDLVCIFPEGQLTRTGLLQPFRRGMERIVKGRKAPIIPINLDHVWGSIFSREGGRYLFKIPRRLPYPVTVVIGEPLPAGTPVHEVRRAVHELEEPAWMFRKAYRTPLHHGFIRAMRQRLFRTAMADVTRPKVSALKTLAGAIGLARALRSAWRGQERVGILLPPSVAGALVNVAAALAGKTSVNLNYTSGRASMGSAAKQAGLQNVVTSRAFLEKAKLELPEGVAPVWVEDVAAGIGLESRAIAMLLALFAPIRVVEKACHADSTKRPTVDDIATVIFSSGSTGEPKGVLLSHFNIDSNVEAAAQIFRLEPEDKLLGILPLFHSFGYMSLWFALNNNIQVVFHPSPLDAGVIGELIQRYRLTLLLATPTFLQIYLRRCTPAQFGSLRIVLAGAEKLPERLAQAFEDNFGIRPLEGYGATECAPVIAASTTDFRAAGLYQPGSRRGFVGQPLPGVSARIVDPDTFEPLPPGTPGMLLVKGANVMQGYLNRPDLTEKVLRDGWYVTGDMALLDEDGFLKITDRLSRFSKIGGEMVPHGRVEEALQDAAGAAQQVFAVTAVPDEKKGERLAVLHTLEEDKLPKILEKLTASGLPNLFIPRRDQFVKVAAIPVLGTGKLDLREVKRVALEALAQPAMASGGR